MSTLVHLIGEDCNPAAVGALPFLLKRIGANVFRQRVVAMDPVQAPRLERRLDRPVETAPSAARLARLLRLEWLVGPGLQQRFIGQQVRLIHAWGRSAQAACRTIPGVPHVVTLPGAPDQAVARRLRASLAENTTLVVGSQTARRRLAEHGLPPERIVVVRAPVDFGAINTARRDNRRAELLDGDDGPLILTTGPASRDGGQSEAAWAVVIVRHFFPALRVAIPFASPERDRIRRYLLANHLGRMIVTPPDDWTWPQLAAAADVLIEPARRDAPTEPLAFAMAAGAAIVGVAVRSTTELIADRHTGLLSRDGSPRGLAAPLLRMLEDADLRRKLSETARGQAYEVFSVREYVDNMRRLYANVLEGRKPGEGVRDTAMSA